VTGGGRDPQGERDDAEPVSCRTSQPIAVCCTNVPLADAI
jgi:hypothetical protein